MENLEARQEPEIEEKQQIIKDPLEILRAGREELKQSPDMQSLLAELKEIKKLRIQIRRDLRFAQQEDKPNLFDQLNEIEEKRNQIDEKISAMKDVIRNKMVNRKNK